MPSKTQSVLLVGVAFGVLSALMSLVIALVTQPGSGMMVVQTISGCLVVCLFPIAVGLLVTWHYTSTHQLTIMGGQGAGLGALAAIVAVVISGGLGYLFQMIGLTPDNQELMRQMNQNADPAQAEQIEQWTELMNSTGAKLGIFVGFALIYGILGAIGGAIGASLFKKGSEPAGERF